MSIWAGLERAARGVPPARLLAGGVIVLLTGRLALSLARSGPVVMADEAGYLMHARVLAGGMPAEMGSSPFYRGGYSLLLAPVVSLAGDPVLAYHGVLAVNALLAACLVPLLYVLLTRGFGAAPQASAWAAVAGAAYPSVTALSQVALSENLLFALTVAWLVACGGLLRGITVRASAGWAVAAGGCAAALWTAHGRMLVVAGLTAVLLVAAALARRRRADAVAAAAGLVALGGGLLAGGALNDRLLERNYDGPRLDEFSRALSALDDPGGIVAMLENVAGHGWYLLVATLGIALVVLARDVPEAVARLWRRRADPADALLALVALATAGLLVASALWLWTRDRPDQLVYGRYVEPLAPVLVAVGIVSLARPGREPRLRALALALAGLTVLVALVRSGLELPVDASRWNVASLPSVTGRLGAAVIAVAGAVAVAALSLLVAVGRRAPAALGLVVVVLFAPTTAYVVYLPVLRSQRDVYPAGWTSPRATAERLGATRVGYDLDRFDHVAVKVYQWFMPRARLVTFEARSQAPPTRLFFSGRRLDRGRATAVWVDPGRDQALWRRGAGR